MSSNPALYRYIKFIGGNILDASNVTLLQTILEGRAAGDDTAVNLRNSLAQLFAQGAMLNGVFNITGTSIVFTHSNGSFPVFALVNDQFESLGNTISISGVQPSSGANNPLFLNWSWDIKTNVDDATFTDGVTGEPTIEAGQLSIDVSWTDTSGVALNPSIQFAKNTTPIILAHFDMSVPAVVTVTYVNGALPYAQGNTKQAGIVLLTDDTGTAPGTTDSRLSDQRVPLPLSVDDTKVKALVSSGFNSTSLPAWAANTNYSVGNQIVDSNGNIETVVNTSGTGTSGGSAPTWNTSLGGQTVDNPGANQVVWVNGGTASTVKYDPATVGQGGIFSDHVIYTTLKEKLTDFLDTVNTSIENTLIALGNHIGKPLGSSNTHPFPTALQVGAAPSSHVGQPLGLTTSHPALVNSDTGGFVTQEVTGSVSGDAYALASSTSVRKAAITHTGDIFSLLANAFTANGGNGTGGTAVNTGALGVMSLIAAVLAEHVNYKSHGNNNPHNLNAADIGSVDAAFVDQQVQSIIDDVTAYTDAKTNISIRVVTTNGPSFPSLSVPSGGTDGVPGYSHNIGGIATTTFPLSAAKIVNVIVNFGGAFEVAFGFGIYADSQQVALPEASGWSGSNFMANAAIAWMFNLYFDTRSATTTCFVDPATRIVSLKSNFDGTQAFVQRGIASVQTIAWRSVAPPPTIISSFDSTVGTFNAGHVGDTVEITGRNFGATQAGSVVRFNGTAVVTYSSWSSNKLIVVVPVGATTGTITVTVGANTATSPFVFTIS